MKLDSVWTSLVYVFNVLTFSSPASPDDVQAALSDAPGTAYVVQPKHLEVIALGAGQDDGKAYVAANGSPLIPTPKNPQEGLDRMTCSYPNMQGWTSCHGPNDRSCWLQNAANPSQKYDITTDYENPDTVPVGVTRYYSLNVAEQPIWPDGVTMEHGKVFNRTYPGPWIEACWGDWIEIKVTNNLRWNGTSVHWHGIRQLHTNHHDGVNGITECPIAPGDSFTYRFRALQYGSAWYHSHYSLQYGDGLLGPMTIYGPSTANYDSDSTFRPILMTDWNHRSVFEDWPVMLETGSAPEMTNILLNGTGQFGPGASRKDKYQLQFEKGKKYMLILVNTAVDTTFVFSIDDHTLEVIEMDFVPIHPYNTTNIKIGIGQRYHVVAHGPANPFKAERNGNFWMRTSPARKCSKFVYGPDQQMGIIRYSTAPEAKVNPLSEPPLYDIACADEPMKLLKPYQHWQVGNPSNIDPSWKDLKTIPWNKRYIFDVHMNTSGGPGSDSPYVPNDRPYDRWSMHRAPFRIDFSEPTILNLFNAEQMINQPYLDVVTFDNHEKDSWIWMVITAPEVPVDGGRIFFPAAHPMHLHGHDFALLAQSSWPWYDDPATGRRGSSRSLTPDKLNCQSPYINCNNPTRRDVVLLPAGGYVVIAFKADNPGAWILHCHIAFHASSGLAIQILENKHLIDGDIVADRSKIEKKCEHWRNWVSDPINQWDWQHPAHFQDDSGV